MPHLSLRRRHAIGVFIYVALIMATSFLALVEADRWLAAGLDNWPLSYEGTPEAAAKMSANSARAAHHLHILIADVVAGLIPLIVGGVVWHRDDNRLRREQLANQQGTPQG